MAGPFSSGDCVTEINKHFTFIVTIYVYLHSPKISLDEAI